MSYVVRHKATGCFLEGQGQWTDHLERALQFNSGLKLVNYVERGGVHIPPDSLEIMVIPPPPAAIPVEPRM